MSRSRRNRLARTRRRRAGTSAASGPRRATIVRNRPQRAIEVCRGKAYDSIQGARARSRSALTETVYIVDDDATFARGLARLVGAAGWKAEVFRSAAEFLAPREGRDGELACVLLDVRMPGMKGPDLYRAMLERKIDLPVIFLTGHGDIPTSVDAMKLGAVDFLEKPVPGKQLIGAIQVAFARHAASRQRVRELHEIESRLARLSVREREVMGHVIAGRLNKQIAADLGISLKTVKAHRAKVMEKMEAGSVAALVDICRDADVGAAAPR